MYSTIHITSARLTFDIALQFSCWANHNHQQLNTLPSPLHCAFEKNINFWESENISDLSQDS